MGAKSSRERKVLQAEIDSLKRDNDSLRAMLKEEMRRCIIQERNSSISNQESSSASVVSIDIAHQIVDQLLADPASNLSFVPDFLERPMTEKAIVYLLKALAAFVDSTNIETMGHEISLRMKPIEPTRRNKSISTSSSESGSGSLKRQFESTSVSLQ